MADFQVYFRLSMPKNRHQDKSVIVRQCIGETHLLQRVKTYIAEKFKRAYEIIYIKEL